jgi:hypothetical protein
MPVVPIAERQQKLRGIPGTTLPQPEMGEGYQKVSETALRMLEGERKKARSDISLEMENDLSGAKNELESRLRRDYRGKQSISASQDLSDEWGKRVSEIKKKYSDSDHAVFDQKANLHWAGNGQLQETILRHSDGEINNYRDELGKSVVDVIVTRAIEQHGNENALNDEMSRLEAVMKTRYPDDPKFAEDKFNEYKEIVTAGIKQLKVEVAKIAKEEKEVRRVEADKSLTDLLGTPELTLKAIADRRDDLGEVGYKSWKKEWLADQKAKETSLKRVGRAVSDDDTNRELSIEATGFHSNSTEEDIIAFKKKTAQAVQAGQLLPKDMRTINTDAEKNTKLDSVRKSALNNVVGFLGEDYNKDMYGEVRSLGARVEYNRQITALNRWVRENPGQDPVEYYEMISEPYKSKWIGGLLEREEVRPVERREEIEERSVRARAIKILEDNKLPFTEANIEYIMGQF